MSDNIPEKIRAIREQITFCEKQYQRPLNTVKLLAVSKTQSAAAIRQAVDCGQLAFGENYLQEALKKIQTLQEHKLEWHFIGPIQSNKTRSIAENFDWVHSVDRLKIAARLSEQRPPGLPPLKLLLQVNLDDEVSKSGLNINELLPLAQVINPLPNIELAGLMAIPAAGKNFDQQRESFRNLALVRDRLLAADMSECLELSMGMSADYEAAIAEGATIVRIGSDIFGPRHQ